MQTSDYITNNKSLFGAATGGKIIQLLALKKLHGAIKTQFTTAHVAVTEGEYIVALNIPWWSFGTLIFQRKKLEAVTLEWLRLYDPNAKSVKIMRKSKNLAKEQAALS